MSQQHADAGEEAVRTSRRARGRAAAPGRSGWLGEVLVALVVLTLIDLTCRWMLGRFLILGPVLDVLRRFGGSY